MGLNFKESQEPLRGSTRRNQLWYRYRRLGIFLTVIIVIIAAAVGTGLGLTRSHDSSVRAENAQPTSLISPVVNTTLSQKVWQPRAGLTWDIQLKLALNASTAVNHDVWDIDLFDNSKETISMMQSRGSKVICYFSAGSYEDWRSDASNFTKSDLGADLQGWPGEKWLKVSSPNVRKIMLARLDMAAEKNCDAVDPDNMDGYQNTNGLSLTQQDAVDYITFLADAAHSRNLAIGLKNAGKILDTVVDVVQFSVNEACSQWTECNVYSPMIQHNKPVFHIEYPKGSTTNNGLNVSASQKFAACNATSAGGFSTVIKNQNLDAWTQFC